MSFEAEHEEVLAALRAIGNPRRGEAVRVDRGSQMEHLGIGFPALRARVKQGFSFSKRPLDEVLPVWDALWHHSPVGDVLFAALAFLERAVRKAVPGTLWPLLVHWPVRVDNWCHADMLANVISQVLQAQPAEVLPQLQAWSREPATEWQRRIALASLIHYSGKNAVFLPVAQMLPVLAAAVGDARPSVQLALGWVLREIDREHPQAVDAFLAEHAGRIGAAARRRALEKRAKR